MTNSKQLIFVDDSGDPGFKSASSAHFIMAAAVFANPEAATILSKEMSNFRRQLGWSDTCEFKFAKDRKKVIINILKIISRYDFQIYAVHIDKISFRKIAPIINSKRIYNWAITELLEIIPINNAKIEIDGRSSKMNMRKTTACLRQSLNVNKEKTIKIKFVDSATDNLIQLADLIAGSINRYMNKDKTDSNFYCNIIKSKIVQIKDL